MANTPSQDIIDKLLGKKNVNEDVRDTLLGNKPIGNSGGPKPNAPAFDSSNPLSIFSQLKPHDLDRWGPYDNYKDYYKWLQTTNYGKANLPQKAPAYEPSLAETLLQQLIAGLGANQPKMLSLEEITNQANQQAGSQYNPQIQAIRDLIRDAKGDAKANKKDIQALYKDLAGGYREDNAWLQKELKTAKSGETEALEALGINLTGQYDQQKADMAANFANLGISDSLPLATAGMGSDQDFLNSLNQTESAAQQRYYDSIAASNNSYFTKGASIANQRGVESIEDLMASLAGYIDQARGEISTLQGQKSSTAQDIINQMQQSQSQAASQNDSWDQMAQLLGIVNSMNNTQYQQQMDMLQLQNQGQGQVKLPSEGISGAQAVLQQMLGGGSQNAVSALQNFLQTVTQREGSFVGANGQANKMTPTQAAFEARKYADTMKLSPQERDALVQAVYAYYGKYS